MRLFLRSPTGSRSSSGLISRYPRAHIARFWGTLPAVLSIKLYVFFVTGHFHGWWRYVTFSDLAALMRASVISLLALVLINHYLLEGYVPRAVVLMDGLVSALALGALRSSWRFFREQFWLGNGNHRVALMVGADHNNAIAAHQRHSHLELPYRIVGFVDDNTKRVGQRLGGIPVLGSIARIGTIASGCKATDVLAVADHSDGRELRELMDLCDEADLRLKIVPSVVEQFSGNMPVRDVEINDLLRRDPVELDVDTITQDVAHKTIMITGAGGALARNLPSATAVSAGQVDSC